MTTPLVDKNLNPRSDSPSERGFRICLKCRINKPISCFYANKKCGGGFTSRCRKCLNEQNRLCRIANYEARTKQERAHQAKPEVKERAKLLRAKNKSKDADRLKKMRAKYPEKYKARNALNNAIRDGKIIRKPCEICGAKAQAHHDDYSKQLDVRWFCQKHHYELFHVGLGPRCLMKR